MLALPAGIKVYLATEPVDRRLGHDGLAARVERHLQKQFLGGHLFVFFNRSKNRVKILYYDDHGSCLWYKRLASGRYRLPRLDGRCQQISRSDLTCLLEGIDLLLANRLQTLAL